jgi:hypothetical protein
LRIVRAFGLEFRLITGITTMMGDGEWVSMVVSDLFLLGILSLNTKKTGDSLENEGEKTT